jgi:glutamate/tyrosine decarboxylase-like PLP-dependent enzyme
MVGRPRNSNREPATKLVRLTPKQWQTMVGQRQGNEPYGDTISRALELAEELQKKVKAQNVEIMDLLEENQSLKLAIESHLRIQRRQCDAVTELEARLERQEQKSIVLELPYI